MHSVIAAFLRAYPGLADPATATSQCRIATTELVARLDAAGEAARAVWVRGHRSLPRDASQRALAADRHLIARTQDGFVDVTRCQFDPRSPQPCFYASEADLAEDWREVDDGPAAGGVDQERWRALARPGTGVNPTKVSPSELSPNIPATSAAQQRRIVVSSKGRPSRSFLAATGQNCYPLHRPI